MNRTHWYFAGLALLVLFAMYAPKIAGYITLLVLTYLAVQLGAKRLI